MRLRLVADDLTGALDTAAQFAARGVPVPVFWQLPATLPPSAALDSGSRERSAPEAAATAIAAAPLLAPGPDVVAFKKLDSLMRGHPGLELAATLHALPAIRHCIIAPAFPFQQRVTKDGRQYAGAGAMMRPVGEDLRATLSGHGIEVRLCQPGDAVPPGVSLWDAATDADLARIAAAGLALDGVLWCGSSGLAGAIVGPTPPYAGALPRPVLGLFGSDHPVTAAQLRDAQPHFVTLTDGGEANARALTARLSDTGMALAAFALPPDLARPDAAARIEHNLTSLLRRIDPPATLIAAGGETLRALCISLGAGRLDVRQQIMPGVPRSIIRGGRWDNVHVVSKSGAFGHPALLRQLLHLPQQRISA